MVDISRNIAVIDQTLTWLLLCQNTSLLLIVIPAAPSCDPGMGLSKPHPCLHHGTQIWRAPIAHAYATSQLLIVPFGTHSHGLKLWKLCLLHSVSKHYTTRLRGSMNKSMFLKCVLVNQQTLDRLCTKLSLLGTMRGCGYCDPPSVNDTPVIASWLCSREETEVLGVFWGSVESEIRLGRGVGELRLWVRGKKGLKLSHADRVNHPS